jgi:hypothetical protein
VINDIKIRAKSQKKHRQWSMLEVNYSEEDHKNLNNTNLKKTHQEEFY